MSLICTVQSQVEVMTFNSVNEHEVVEVSQTHPHIILHKSFVF